MPAEAIRAGAARSVVPLFNISKDMLIIVMGDRGFDKIPAPQLSLTNETSGMDKAKAPALRAKGR